MKILLKDFLAMQGVKGPEKKDICYCGIPCTCTHWNSAIDDFNNIPVDPRKAITKCKCERHPDSVFTVQVVNDVSYCPRCGGIVIPVQVPEPCTHQILDKNNLSKLIQYWITEGPSDTREIESYMVRACDLISENICLKFKGVEMPSVEDIEQILIDANLEHNQIRIDHKPVPLYFNYLASAIHKLIFRK